jgi:hypothetical protein
MEKENQYKKEKLKQNSIVSSINPTPSNKFYISKKKLNKFYIINPLLPQVLKTVILPNLAPTLQNAFVAAGIELPVLKNDSNSGAFDLAEAIVESFGCAYFKIEFLIAATLDDPNFNSEFGISIRKLKLELTPENSNLIGMAI